MNGYFRIFALLAIVETSFSFLSQPLRNARSYVQNSNANGNTNTIEVQHHASSTILNESSSSSLEIVLFGTGDLRTTDHGGLSKALSSTSTSNILPLFILDTKDTLPNMPMGRTHAIDNASLLHASLTSLQKKLKKDHNLDLHVCTGKDGEGVLDCVQNVIRKSEIDVDGTTTTTRINVHSCDLGDVDNRLGYGPFGHLNNDANANDEDKNKDFDINVIGWDCFLRNSPWDDLSSNVNNFPSVFTDYEQAYSQSSSDKNIVTDMYTYSNSNNDSPDKSIGMKIPSMMDIPSVQEISELLCKALNLNDKKEDLESEINTGLYATHWGGLDIPSTMDEDCILNAVDIFLGKSNDNNSYGDEALAETLKWWSQNSKECKLTRNPKSLEHATIDWLMSESENEEGIKTKNLIENELLVRYLAAPLLFGTVSSRYLWKQSENIYQMKQISPLEDFFSPILPSVRDVKQSVQGVKSIAENREWHQLFAAKNLRIVKSNASSEDPNPEDVSYDYFRWHGFLCRYGTTSINSVPSTSSKSNTKKEGVVLVHGFGASGSQWEKAMAELRNSVRNTSNNADEREIEALAPDLLGFGQCEKPSISYSQYLWEGYTADCVKEVGLGKRDWSSFTIGGNSIGGYTAMSAAADDMTTSTTSPSSDGTTVVSALGSNGSGRCKGLVLMNSAGRILTKAEVNDSENTVAEMTALDMLGASSPPPRDIAKYGGNGLLAYLRPRIQSICTNLYPTNPAAVDNNLCDGILRDSLDPGAINVMISGSKLPPPRTANELLGADFGSSTSKNKISSSSSSSSPQVVRERTFDGPVLVAQGILDPLNDAKGRADMLDDLRMGVTVSRMDAGHCPHDELPGLTAANIAGWLNKSVWTNAEESKEESMSASTVV